MTSIIPARRLLEFHNQTQRSPIIVAHAHAEDEPRAQPLLWPTLSNKRSYR
jgi:hypothetical protein